MAHAKDHNTHANLKTYAASQSFVPGRVGIVGLGLIGGSFARALHGAGREVYASNRNKDTLRAALIETIDAELTDELIPSCEMIILASYPKACIEWLTSHAELIAKDALVIDCSGTKRLICEKCFALADKHDWYFCGSHPMAGTQFSGFARSRATLFKGAPMVLVPPEMDDFDRVALIERIQKLLEPCEFGSWSITSPDLHDERIAYTSQLAHVVSNAYVKSPTAQSHKGFSAGSYKDLTRVARLNAQMWTELFLENADNLIEEIDVLQENLAAYKTALETGNVQVLEKLLEEGDRLKREAESL